MLHTPPPPGEDVPAILLTALLSPPSTPELLLFLQQRTGSSSQPPYTCPGCRPPGYFLPSPEHRELSNFSESLQLTLPLYIQHLLSCIKTLNPDSAELSPGICLNKLHVETGSSEAGMRAGHPSLPYSAQCGSFPSPGSLSSL